MMGEDIVGGAGHRARRMPGEASSGVSKGALRKHRRPDDRYAAVGKRLYRRGNRRGGLRHAADRGADVHRLHRRLLRRDLQPGRQVPLHVRRQGETPVVIRAMVGAGFRAAAQHSQMLTPIFTHIPGLKVVCPSNAYDAKGLLIQSIRDNDPVIFWSTRISTAMNPMCRRNPTSSPSARRTSCARARTRRS